MKVFHVEQRETGEGPYNSYWQYQSELNSAHYGDDSHPTPEREIENRCSDETIAQLAQEGLGDAFIHGVVCGFSTIEQMQKWFDGWIDKLDNAGFVVAVYDVDTDDVLSFDYQVIFDHKAYVPVEKVSLSEAKTMASTF